MCTSSGKYFRLRSISIYPVLVVISISMHKTKPEGIGGIMLTSPMGIRENNLFLGNKINITNFSLFAGYVEIFV